jgi:excisionase family DNA binding protein
MEMGMEPIGPFYDVDGARAYLGRAPESTFRLWVREGQLRAFRVGRRLAFSQRDLEEFARRQAVETSGAA